MTFVETNSLSISEQHDLRKGLSHNNHLFLAIGKWIQCLGSRKSVNVFYGDLKKLLT